jgi:hypothetical protein
MFSLLRLLTFWLVLTATQAFGDEPIVCTVEPNKDGKLVFPKVTKGDTVAFLRSCAFNGDIKVSVDNGASVTQRRHETAIDGKILATGTKNFQFEVSPTKAGKTTIRVSVKDGDTTKVTEYELQVE